MVGLEALPEGERSCELPVAAVEPILLAILPGLIAHPYMTQRLLLALSSDGGGDAISDGVAGITP